MLFYFSAPYWVIILILLFATVIPLAVFLLAFFVVRDLLKWEKSKDVKKKNSSNSN